MAAPRHTLIHRGENLVRALRKVGQGAHRANQQRNRDCRRQSFAADVTDDDRRAATLGTKDLKVVLNKTISRMTLLNG